MILAHLVYDPATVFMAFVAGVFVGAAAIKLLGLRSRS